MQRYCATIWIESYIAQPYWPEINDVIEIQKKSGMNLVRDAKKRESRLKAYLDSQGIAMETYEKLKVLAARRWYRVNNMDPASEIVIPNHQFSGMLVQAVKSAPSTARIPVDDLRSRLRVSDFHTGKIAADRIYRRYVKGDQSNQRRLQEDEVIENFEATGTVEFDPAEVKPRDAEALLQHGLTQIGLGAARKMGFGRGKLISLAKK